METFRIFIVEDDPWYGEILAYHLSLNPDYEVLRFTSGKDCIQNMGKKPNLVTIDYSLPDMNGQELYKQLQASIPGLPVIVISGQEDIQTAVGMLKLGVNDYLVKDENTKDILWNAVIRIREMKNLQTEVEHLREELGQKYSFDKSIKGNSPAIRKVFGMMEKATQTNINVSVTGETGTGKELVAKAIHYNSARKKQPFVAVNMAAIPSELIESELFGHEKGSFTGAVSRKIGKFEEANKGTVFLDEIAELDLSVQSKLLRVLQERELIRVGGNEKVKLDVRLVIATHKNLADEVKKGNFREDLYYRIMGLPIELPPLRERGNDILLLSKYFADDFCKENKMNPLQIANAAKEKLMAYHFPGNIRELKASIELAAVLCNGQEITAADLSFGSTRNSDFFLSDEKTLKEYNNMIISYFLRKYDNNVLRVADKLDVGKSTIYKMIQQKEILV